MKDNKQTKFSMLDAFLALEDVEDDEITLPLNEGKSYSIYNEQEMKDAAEFREKDEKVEDTVLEVIDVDANTVEQIKDPKSYIGQMLLQCNSCKSTRFIDVDALKPSESDDELYNIEDECPHCHNTGIGFTLIGQVGKMPEEEASVDNEQAADETTFDNDVEDESNEETNDAFDDVASEPVEDEPSDEEKPYDETTAEDDTEDLDTPKLGDEIDSDDVAEDDTEESDEEEKKEKSKNESLEESYDPLTLDDLINQYRYDYNESNHEKI